MKHNHGIVKVTECPTCHHKVDAAAEVKGGDYTPRPGDISICFECGEVLIFTSDLGLTKADLDDMMQLDEDERNTIGQAQLAIRNRKSNERHNRT